MEGQLRDVIKKKLQSDPMLLSTTDIQDFEIYNYIGIATGVAVISSGAVRDYIAHIKDFTGGTPSGYVEDFKKAIHQALEDMVNHAKSKGANAITGISVVPTTISTERGGFFFALATGTALSGEIKATPQDKKDNKGNNETCTKDQTPKQ